MRPLSLTPLMVLLTALNTLPAFAASPLQLAIAHDGQTASAPPKLIIGIAVDQLRTDYLEILQSRFGEGGFKRLMREGLVFEQVSFELDNPDVTTALAVLATGSYPFQNGISSQFVFDTQTLRRHSVFFDLQYIGNATDGSFSPRALLSSTLGDELKLASQHQSRVYSLAPNAEEALIAAGHSADGAFWLDDKTGRWCSSTYYKEFPNFISGQNSIQPLFFDPTSQDWNSQLFTRDGRCPLVPYTPCNPYFSHKLTEGKQVMYQWIKTTPFINEALTRLAKLFVTNTHLGQIERRTDMLQLTFYAGTYQHTSAEVYPCELEETYMRLDQNLAELFSLIDQKVGLQNTVIYLTGTGDTNRNTPDVPGLSLGEFNANRCTALLNIQLNSLYGQGQWIEGFEEKQIYLNHKTIEQKQLQLDEVSREAAKFVSLFSGVDEVFTAQQLLHEDYSQRISRIRNSYRKAGGGDLVILLQPGWSLRINDQSKPQPQTRHDVSPAPAILFAPTRIAAERITAPVEATAIAPTVAKAIRIRAPSACRALPLR